MTRKSIAGIALLLLAVTVVFGFQRITAQSQSTTDDLETAIVKRGTLIASVSASGTVEAKRRMALTFPTPGRVAEVYVAAGDEVSAGDPLVQLNTDELELQVAQARAGLAAAEAQLAQLKAGATAEDLAAAQATYESAQAQLEKLQAGADEAEIQAARASLDSARKNLNKVLNGPSQFDLDRAKRNLDQAKNQLYSAQSQRDSVCGRVGLNTEEAITRQVTPASQAQCNQAEAQVLVAQVNVDQAVAALEELNSQPDETAVASAQAQVAQAEAQLDRLLRGASDAELAAAQAQVRQAEAQLQKLKSGAREEELAVAEAQVEQAQVRLKQADLALKNATLTASMSGTVAVVGATEGELISQAQPAVVLIDTSDFKITLAIDETDIGKIEVGQPATIRLDAFPDEELTGQVTEVSPAGTATQGIVTYSVTVRPDSTEAHIKPGMTAGVDIVIAEKDNVLLVPNRAIRTEQGQRVVLIPSADGAKTVAVDTGLRNEQFVEIESGLSEGDTIVTSIVPTNKALEGGFFGND